MALYVYFKAETRPKKKISSWFPVVFFLLGAAIIANVFLPLLVYQSKSQTDFKKKLLSPIKQDSFQVLGQETSSDYDRPQNWFSVAPKLPPRPTKITHYNISIPKLRIKQAVATVDGDDLSESLVQYSGTALPGQYGNPVIFGHSTLPQFFNPQNYHSIFSTLPNLKKGDQIIVDFDGITYNFEVAQMIEVEPDDFSILAQYYDGQYLTLVTCVPPGTLIRRLVVRARLI